MKMTMSLMGAGLVWVLLTAGANAWASEPLRGCAAKQAEIEQQLAQAREAGRKGQIAGLEKALAAQRSECTDEGLRRERQAAVEKARQEVLERERDVRAAQAGGRDSKILRRKEKLDEARRELTEALNELGR